MQLQPATAKETEQIKSLYLKAFPQSERKPFSVIEKRAANGEMEILALRGQAFCGLVITAVCEELVLVDYFAVSEAMRGGGLGSEALSLIRERYKGKNIFLEIERADAVLPADDARMRRKRFYLRNGLVPAEIFLKLFGVPMEILSFGDGLSKAECQKMYRFLYGRLYPLFIRLP